METKEIYRYYTGEYQPGSGLMLPPPRSENELSAYRSDAATFSETFLMKVSDNAQGIPQAPYRRKNTQMARSEVPKAFPAETILTAGSTSDIGIVLHV